MTKFEKLDSHVFVTKLAGFEHTEYIQNVQTRTKVNDDDIPLVQGKNIRKGFFVEKYDWYLSKSVSDNLERSKLDKECILIPYVGSNLGEVGIFYHPYDCHLASNIAKIELLDDYYDIEFLKYYLQSPVGQAYLFQAKQGSAQPNITMEAIRNTLVIDIDINKQKQIAKVLSVLDKKIQLNLQICNELEALAKSIYDYWFIQFDFPNSNGKPYKTHGGKMKWDEGLKREIPESWKVGNLYDIADFINGLPCQKYRPNDEFHKLPVIKIKEMHEGVSKDTEWVSDNIPEKNIIEAGDILFSWSASLETMVWPGCRGGLNQHIFKVVPKVYTKYYVYMQLSAYIINFRIMAEARKTTMGHITTEHLKQSKIVLPDIGVVEEFEGKIRPIIDKILKVNLENQELQSLKNFMLPMLMNGQIGFKED